MTVDERKRRRELATSLLLARDAHIAALAAEHSAAAAYRDAERAFLEATGAGDLQNIVVDGNVIVPHEDWWDVKEGKRIAFHTAERV